MEHTRCIEYGRVEMTYIPIMDEKERLSAAVQEFSEAMKVKLFDKTNEGKSGWDDCAWPVEDIKKQLIEHVEKGDFVDVANFAMFAFFRIER